MSNSTIPVLIHNFKGSDIIVDFYKHCGLETIGPARIPTGSIERFKTFEELIDRLAKLDDPQVIVVSHGHSEHGLLLPFTSASKHNATGLIIASLGSLADRSSQGSLDSSDAGIRNIAAQMGTKPSDALQLVESIVKLRLKKKMIHIRGCNLGANAALMGDYKRALNLLCITAPNCRNVYAGVNTKRPKKGTVDELGAKEPTTPKTRRRLFTWPENSQVGSLVVDIRDIDGHTHLDTEAFLADPNLASYWGERLLGTWRQAPNSNRSQSFILQVFWDNGETSWHTPLEPSFRTKIVAV